MSLDAATLLAGPRGRRLLLEFAVRSEALASGDVTTELPLWKAVFDHVVAHGSSRPVAGWGEDFIARPTSPEELARRLAEVPLVRARPTLLLDALQRSVAAATHGAAGEGPDEVTSLLAGWRLDPGLARVARQVAATGKVGWWSKSLRRDGQFVVVPRAGRGKGKTSPKPPTPREALARQSGDDSAGQWSSAPGPALPVSSRPWPRRGPLELLFGGAPAGEVRRLPVARSTRILEIDGDGAWLELCRRCPRDVTATHGPAWSAASDRGGGWVAPDWRRVARHHDVVHLPVASWLALSDRPLTVEPGVSTMLTGWLPGTAVWLRTPG